MLLPGPFPVEGGNHERQHYFHVIPTHLHGGGACINHALKRDGEFRAITGRVSLHEFPQLVEFGGGKGIHRRSMPSTTRLFRAVPYV